MPCQSLLRRCSSADLHGVSIRMGYTARLIGYVRLKEAGRANPNPVIRIILIHETPSTAVVDGDGGLGLVVAPFAMQVAIDKARQVGTGWVSVQHSQSFWYCRLSCAKSGRSRHDRDSP